MTPNNEERNDAAVRLSSVMDTYSTRKSVVKLGIDILEQLIALKDKGTKCAVLTPADINVSPLGDFSLNSVPQRPPEKSDRFSHLIQLYAAPEVYDGVEGDGPALYSLGTIMYKLLNGGLEPFRSGMDFDSAATAYKLRMSGLRLSAPVNADALLSAIIIKACEYSTGQRYVYAEDMLEELMLLTDGTYKRKPRVVPEEQEPRKEEFKKLPYVAMGVGGALVALAIILFSVNFRCNDIYIRAERYMRDGKYNRAEEMFGKIEWYKDSRQMLLKCDFQRADALMEQGSTDKAIQMYEELVSKGYADARQALNSALLAKAEELRAEGKNEEALELMERVASEDSTEAEKLIADHKYQEAEALYKEGKYEEAGEIFASLGHEDMTDECDYCIASEHQKEGNFTEALTGFNFLDGYNDSNGRFADCENQLLAENRDKDIFGSIKSLGGRYSDDAGHYVEYGTDGEKTTAVYSLPHEEGKYFRVKDGIHYHSADGNNWEKQWIYQNTASGELSVYNYIDGKTYVLTKE